MGIRRRLRRPILTGIPAPEFEGYVRRFGHVYAEFSNAAMLNLMGRAPDFKRRSGESPTIHFYTHAGLLKWIAHRRATGLPVQFLKDVRDNWPDTETGEQLRSFTFQPAD